MKLDRCRTCCAILTRPDEVDYCISCRNRMTRVDLKYDQDKIRMDLLPWDCLSEIAKVLTYGANKYEANSWQNLRDSYNRYRGSLLRHLASMEMGEDVDPESGLLHAAHLACNSIFLLWFILHREEQK